MCKRGSDQIPSGKCSHFKFLYLSVMDEKIYGQYFFFNFCSDKPPFCRATGTFCFRLWLTLPMGFKARVDAPFSALSFYLHVMILKVNSHCPDQILVPILHLRMVRLSLE